MADTPAAATPPVGAPDGPVARGPVPPPEPTAVVAGWLVSTRTVTAPLTLVDVTPLRKVQVRADVDGGVATVLGVPHGRAHRDERGRLVLGAGPGRWLVVGRADDRTLADTLTAEVARARSDGEVASVRDLTHQRALFRLTGARAPELLARLCAVDLTPAAFDDGAVARTAVARVATEVVRDDRQGTLSILLACETSFGRYLFDEVVAAGSDLDLEVGGFTADP